MEKHTNYFGFGYTILPYEKRNEAIGCLEHTRLGATLYYIQIGTVANPKWRQVERDRFDSHVKAIEPDEELI